MSPKGGKRLGSGRPKGGGKYAGEVTKVVRIPESRLSLIQAILEKGDSPHSLPLFSSKVQAGFPSPADDYIERHLDLNAEFIKHPSSTFLLRASGDSMIEAGIFSGDLLVVDRSIEPNDGKIVIVALNGELTVKRLSRKPNQIQLLPANPKFAPIDITEEADMVIWGVVTLVLHEPQ